MTTTISIDVPANTWTLIYSGSQAISLGSSVSPLFLCVQMGQTLFLVQNLPLSFTQNNTGGKSNAFFT